MKMPKFDISLPKVNFPEGDVKFKGPDTKGRKIELPDIDITLPKGKAEGDIKVEGPEMKGGKFKMPRFGVSLPKVSLPKLDAKWKDQT